jgi:hypothetical protein
MLDLDAKMAEVAEHLKKAAQGIREAFELNEKHVAICTQSLTIAHEVATKLMAINVKADLRTKLPRGFCHAIGHDAVTAASAKAIRSALQGAGIAQSHVCDIQDRVRRG